MEYIEDHVQTEGLDVAGGVWQDFWKGTLNAFELNFSINNPWANIGDIKKATQ